MTGAETTADLAALTSRLRRALGEAEVLGLHDVEAHLEQALALAVRQGAEDGSTAGGATATRSIGQHEAAS